MLIFEGKGENVYIEHKHSLLFLFCVFYMHFSTSLYLWIFLFVLVSTALCTIRLTQSCVHAYELD